MKHTLLKFTAFFATIFACLMLPVAAQEADPAVSAETSQDAEAPKRARPALWKIADEDTTIYLFGTIHVLPGGIDWYHSKVAEAFDDSGSLITEIAENDPARMQSLLVKIAMLPPTQNLRAQLNPEGLNAYEAALTEYQIPVSLFDRFEPWYVAIALSTMPLMQEGYDTANGVDEILDVKAKARGLPHTGLETPEYQLGLFDGLPEDVQMRYLGEVVEQLPDIKTDIAAMVEAWKNGDAEALASLMNSEESDPEMNEALLINRNRSWAKWLNELLDTPGTVFVAVGAGHLAGDGSVQDQLCKLGITSTRLQ